MVVVTKILSLGFACADAYTSEAARIHGYHQQNQSMVGVASLKINLKPLRNEIYRHDMISSYARTVSRFRASLPMPEID